MTGPWVQAQIGKPWRKRKRRKRKREPKEEKLKLEEDGEKGQNDRWKGSDWVTSAFTEHCEWLPLRLLLGAPAAAASPTSGWETCSTCRGALRSAGEPQPVPFWVISEQGSQFSHP